MTDVPPLNPVRFTRELCEIESTTYNEGAVGDFLENFLAGRGWTVEKTPVPQPIESENTSARWNIYAGSEGQTPDLVFSTHMDTVPPYIPFSEDTEFMYGRGVSDAKGIIAAQVAAAEALRAEGFRVGMLFVSGEERDSAGAKVANLTPKGIGHYTEAGFIAAMRTGRRPDGSPIGAPMPWKNMGATGRSRMVSLATAPA